MPETTEMSSLEHKLDLVSVLARPRQVDRLSGGLTNVNLKITTDAGVFVARCFGGDERMLGIDRDTECHNTRAAATAGVGAPVVDYRPDLGMLVIEYIDGVTYDNSSFAGDGVVRRVADACRTLHSGPRFVNDFDMFARQPGYLRVARDNGFRIPEGYDLYAAQFERIREALSVQATETVPCNNDLLAGNFVDDGDKLWLIDYEYSGNNDACFELGNITTECELDDDQIDELVTAYYGQRLRNKLARARLQAMVSQYGWALWGAIQAATSALDFDFTSWGRERFEKAATGFTAGSFDRLIEEVQRDD